MVRISRSLLLELVVFLAPPQAQIWLFQRWRQPFSEVDWRS